MSAFAPFDKTTIVSLKLPQGVTKMAAKWRGLGKFEQLQFHDEDYVITSKAKG